MQNSELIFQTDISMPSIDIHHPHTRSLEEARQAVDRVAQKLQDRFDVQCEWNDDCLEFSRTGVEGEIRLSDEEIHVMMDLGFLLSALRGPIEGEIRRYLEREFS